MAVTDYKSTLKLPRTDFPMKANLPKREPEMLKRWAAMTADDATGIYRLLMAKRKDAPLWILHDGPPYANGRVHIGTALNKILKDFIVRSRSMMGNRAAFVPGWDCHGMPIELRVARELGEKARTMPKLELRALCRAQAEHWIDVQREEFRRLGAIGDWENPYLTFTPGYDASEIGVLRKLVEEGYIYRGLRPVHWCFDCRTALAEAEVEYREHQADSIYVAFAFNGNLDDAAALAADPKDGAELGAAHRDGKFFAVIWTTTPWTLPANLGISLNQSFEYVAMHAGDAWYVVAARLADQVIEACGLSVDRRIPLSAEALHALDGKDVFSHPFAGRDSKLMFAEHVTADTGTGLVHTAPGHGYEDFVIGAQYGLPTLTPVDDAGVFTAEAGKYAGRNVFEANDAIVADLRAGGALLSASTFIHSYPHCWRCKNPLIFRATEQWFIRIDHADLRGRMLTEIDAVSWIPKWSRDRIRNMVETRPDWCLSRQRAWGVPIPAVRCSGCGEVTLDAAVMRQVEEIFAQKGSDEWYARPLGDFLPEGFKCPKCGRAEFTREEDVLDVWFDSGCSHAAVLEARTPELRWPADAYVEGIDQARGWFQVSLITATAARGGAPYKNVVTHGLALDEVGRKMSKSLGNAEDAVEVVNRIGADILRLVFASVDYASDMNVGENLFKATAEAYRKIRNTCRYMLGNLSDFDPVRDQVPLGKMLEFDRYILTQTQELAEDVWIAFESFDFQTAWHAISNFVVVELSSLYIDVARDRLYCSAAESIERRSAQTALYLMLDTLVRMIAPLIPFTAEEIYAHIPGRTEQSVHLLELNRPDPHWEDPELVARWERLLEVRGETLKLLETMRQKGTIGAPLEAAVQIAYNFSSSDESESAVESESLPEQARAAALLGSQGQISASDQHDKVMSKNSGQPSSTDLALLQELLIVSKVDPLSPEEAAEIRRRMDGTEALSADGVVARVADDPPLVIVGRRAAGLKCQRCWMYYDDGGDPELCPRCRAVVRGHAHG
ncbi:MAG TPA: isoleucine--tRNA ligase [Candidatus Binataceae bacterium]|nr:isoleucine--tRNA ligase [Candidatus Binataceae bacterium]